ncbi:calcium-translocating P-type ATPase, SERCA-type, partial [Candidatus Aminicenantes bacterium AC-335-G13]|nr:calcium-translocating P-type ATPase, SERCA-type [Candidatus Aminicenantes bacterium AC-335-G13]
HYLEINEILKKLNTDFSGLSSEEARRRLEKYGYNEIRRFKRITPFQIFIRQFTSFLVLILISAIVISLLIGEKLDAIVISCIVVLNGIFGFVQEYKAERAIEALKKLTALKAKVLRDGKVNIINAEEVVPGDIILLETGDKVPADSRLFSTSALQINEASLTGESIPSKKHCKPLPEETPVVDQENMAFMGTVVTRGRGKAIVVRTGMDTELGKIAEMVQEVEEKLTPLQITLKEFSKWLGIVTIGICFVIFLIGISRQFITTGNLSVTYLNMIFLAAVSLAVAAIPEGLPAIVTITLALGVQRMAKRNALIRQLPAVETLGCTNIICTDKTGTLTKNEMTVKKLFVDNKIIEVTGEGYKPEGKIVFKENEINKKDLQLLLKIGALCNNAGLIYEKIWKIIGDPTEGALIVSALKFGIDKKVLEKELPRIEEIPFEPERKLMTTIHKCNEKIIAFVKGAPDIILEKCMYIQINGKIRKITEGDKEIILKANQEMANKALRVLGFAYKEIKEDRKLEEKNIEKDLIFVGLQGMLDPLREEAKDAIKKCKLAGIRTVIITGDHKFTAMAVAKELGLIESDKKVLTGEELNKMDDRELEEAIDKIVIYARVSPHHKVRILEALKKKGYVVAMTGDGINDAPALKKSDIGVAMGISGTDVAKEASDMVLVDDNFASIVNAVEEGRGIYQSIKEFVQYTLSSNLGEILVIFLAILIGWPLPLIAIQILWVNLLTDGLPGLALGLDPFDKAIMKKPPRRKGEKIVNKEVIENILIVGIVMCIGTLLLFHYYGLGTTKARSIAFTTLVMFQLFNVLTYRAKKFKIEFHRSKFLISAVIISLIMQIVILYPPLNIAFKTTPLSLTDWLKIILISFTLYIILEVRKIVKNRKLKINNNYANFSQ